MTWSRVTRWTLAVSIVSLASCQYSGWEKNQVNATMCLWQSPRVAVLRDTAYIDGGWLTWTAGMADGQYGDTNVDGNPLGNIYLLNFSKPFNTSGNASEAFDLFQSPEGLSLNNLKPNYIDGALLANDYEFFLYGGLLTQSSVNSLAPAAREVLAYQKYQYGLDKPRFAAGFSRKPLPDTLTRYIGYGGAASVPSENKAFYFGGFHSPLWGDSFYPSLNASTSATEASSSLITLDMATQNAEAWTNTTLQSDIKGRGGADLVWVPVGGQGILVALGGVTYPDFSSANLSSANEAQSENDSPAFMSTIDIYDIASGKWYKQTTVDGPGQLALGCAVVAVAQDSSSYNIYYYGGYDGIHQEQAFNDAVWILSLPSFTWTKVSDGTTDHARAGHRCVTPYPDQMIVIGGYPSLGGAGATCVQGGVLQVFNLTEARWVDRYDPEVYGDYGVPALVRNKIGGTDKGAATLTTPSPSGWQTPNLAKVFETKYSTSKITTYYPYSSHAPTDVRPEITTNSVPSWLAPVLGVVLGLVFITAVVVAILLYRRRKLLRSGASDGQTDENGHRILSWLGGQDRSHKAQTVTSEEPSNTVDDFESRIGSQTPHLAPPEMVQTQRQNMSEMPETALYEMMDTSPRPELGDTGLSPVEIINKHTHFATSPHPRSTGTPTNPSSYSNFSGSHDHASISTNSQSRANFAMSDAGRPDSPALGNSHAPAPSVDGDSHQQAGDPRIVSGISAISQRDVAHLRNISDASVSTASGAAGAAPVTPIIGSSSLSTPPLPVSPPSPRLGQEDYFQSVEGTLNSGAGPAASPLRRSVFVENQDDLEGERRHEK